MEPTIQPTELLFVEKISGGALLPHRFSDIPILNICTRLDIVRKIDNRIDWGYNRTSGIKGIKPNDIVLFYAPDKSGNILVKRIQYEVADSTARWFFMAGDNTENSCDSRTFGLVPEQLIIGRVCLVLFSVNNQPNGKPKIKWEKIGRIPH